MRRILFSLMVIASVVALISGGTLAWFTDTAASTPSTFTSGTLSINDGLVVNSGAIPIPNMAPGDLTDPITIEIKNNGSLNLGWVGDWQFTGNAKLQEALYIASAKMEFLKPDGSAWEPTDEFITNGRGSGPYPSWFNILASSSPFNVVTFKVWDGNDGMGVAPYEHMGALKPGYSYKLTVRFGMAELAGNEYQSLGPTSASLVVKATQINAAAMTAFFGPDDWAGSHIPWMNAQLAKQN